MNIEKIIKIYFLFVLLVIATSVAYKFDSDQSFFVSLFHADRGEISESNGWEQNKYIETALEEKAEIDKPLDFVISYDGENAYALAGEKDQEIMKIDIKPLKGNFYFRYLQLKISGVHPLGIEKAYIEMDGKVISKAKKKNEYLIFKDVNLSLDEGENAEVLVKIDLSEYLSSGQRISAQIESADDIEVFLNGKQYKFENRFPFYGGYLSIIKERPKVIYTYNNVPWADQVNESK